MELDDIIKETSAPEKEQIIEQPIKSSKICENLLESSVKSQKSPKSSEKKKKKEKTPSDKKERKGSKSLEPTTLSIVDTSNDIPEFVIPSEATCRPGTSKGLSDANMVNEENCLFGSSGDHDGLSSSESQRIPSLSKFEVLTYYLQNVSITKLRN
jgi:hypothetical protein